MVDSYYATGVVAEYTVYRLGKDALPCPIPRIYVAGYCRLCHTLRLRSSGSVNACFILQSLPLFAVSQAFGAAFVSLTTTSIYDDYMHPSNFCLSLVFRGQQGCVLIACWGVPGRSYPDNGNRCLAAAVEIHASLQVRDMKTSMGITTGHVRLFPPTEDNIIIF